MEQNHNNQNPGSGTNPDPNQGKPPGNFTLPPDIASALGKLEVPLDMVPGTAAYCRREIEQWIKNSNFVHVELGGVFEESHQIQFHIGFQRIPFQIFVTEQWQPMFVATDDATIQEFITPINFQIEEAASQGHPLSVINFLNTFGVAFKEIEEQIAPPRPPAPHFTNFPISSQINQPEPHVPATAEDWQNIILPELRQALVAENLQNYEIEEWMRRVQAQLSRGDTDRALQVIQNDILPGNIPNSIRKFFPPMNISRPFRHDEESLESAMSTKYVTVGGTKEASERILTELTHLKTMKTKDLGFSAGPIGTDLYHWSIKLFGFADTPLGKDLTEWALKHHQINDFTRELDQNIELEMKFPPNFPHESPLFRIVKPRFENIDVDLRKHEAEEVTVNPNGKRSLTFSTVLENNTQFWNPQQTIVAAIQHIRQYLIESNAKVDLESGKDGYSLPTIGGFWRSYKCQPPAGAGKVELENGGKVILPTSALEELSQYDMERTYYHSLSMSRDGNSPMLFEISTEKGRRSFCGVEEFTAPEGYMVIPQWMMNNLGAQPDTQIQVRRVNLPKGTFVKLQPHNHDFLAVNDTKALLEWVLPKFVVMNLGDTIVINYRNKKYAFNVLEVRPGRAVHIIDSDVTTEFAPPLEGGLAIPIQGLSTAPSVLATTPPKFSKEEIKEESKESKGLATGRLVSGTEGVDFKVCDNCRQRIPMMSYNMHTLSCARINWFCAACNDSYQKSAKDEHMATVHKLVHCECGQQLENRFLAQHKADQCGLRIVVCSYCPLEMTFIEKQDHERSCGSQTQKCENCNRFVTKKDMDNHLVACLSQEGSFESESSRGRGFIGYNASRSVPRDEGLACPICQNTFIHLDDLQVHMLSEHDETQFENSNAETSDPMEVDKQTSNQ